MTNVENIIAIKDIHLNISEAFKFIDQHLPEKYSREVLNLLDESQKVDLAYIRQVKKNKIKNAPIISALYRVALRSKTQKENQ